MPQVWNAIKAPQVRSFALLAPRWRLQVRRQPSCPNRINKMAESAIVLTERHWAIYETEARTECPQGMNSRGLARPLRTTVPRGWRRRADSR